MLIKTVVTEQTEGSKLMKSFCKKIGESDSSEIELTLAEIEYDDAFLDTLSNQVKNYSIHTLFTYDYESSSDAGDGRDDSYQEEADEPLRPDMCIVKDGQLYGVLCEAFDVQAFLLLSQPVTIIYHPKNYGGRNYHFYRSKQFTLVENK